MSKIIYSMLLDVAGALFSLLNLPPIPNGCMVDCLGRRGVFLRSRSGSE